MMLVTSISPTRLEAQEKAISTWKKYNVPIYAVQCYGEDYATDFTGNIIWVKPNKHWSKRTPSISDIINPFQEPFILINSDIELELESLPTPKDNTFTIGLRTDYCPQFKQLNKYGIDLFLITPEMQQHLTNNIWAVGIPGWDYYVLWSIIQAGYDVDIIKEGILHEAHKEQWDKNDYRRCSKLLEFQFDIPVCDIADGIQELTGRTHLTKRVIT